MKKLNDGSEFISHKEVTAQIGVCVGTVDGGTSEAKQEISERIRSVAIAKQHALVYGKN